MTTAFLRKLDDSGILRPDDSHSESIVARWKVDDVLRCDVRRPRNVNHHRWFFALLRYIVENTDDFPTEEHALDWLKYKTGHYEAQVFMEGPKVQTIVKLRSISFGSMNEDEFTRFKDRCLDVVAEYMGGLPEDVQRGIEEFMR